MTEPARIILAIESAIAGGSISLLRDGAEIANWTGTSNVSKAEELLVNIDELLRNNNIAKNNIGLIAVSAGPGSFTGIRIGIATALGLKAGLGIAMASASALKAMAALQPDSENIVVAVPMGRNAVCVQAFRKSGREVTALHEPRTMREDEFLSSVANGLDRAVVLHAALYERIAPLGIVSNFGSNIAYAIGMFCDKHPDVNAEPLFISKSF